MRGSDSNDLNKEQTMNIQLKERKPKVHYLQDLEVGDYFIREEDLDKNGELMPACSIYSVYKKALRNKTYPITTVIAFSTNHSHIFHMHANRKVYRVTIPSCIIELVKE